MKVLTAIFAIYTLSMPCLEAANTNGVIYGVEDLADVLSQKYAYNRKFEIRAIAYSAPIGRRRSFFALSENGKGVPLFDMREENVPPIRPGDMILVQGVTSPRHGLHPEDGLVNANCENVTILGQGPPIRHHPTSASDIDSNKLLYMPIQLNGILVDMRMDEIDPDFTSFVIDCDGRIVHAITFTATVNKTIETLKHLVGATVAIDGILTQDWGSRIHHCRYIALRGIENMQVLKSLAEDLFSVPEIGETEDLSPDAIIALGRRRTSGRVLAVWNDNTILLRTKAKSPINVGLIGAPPAIGDDIEVVGYTETDLFRVNLANAMWRKTQVQSKTEDEPVEITAKDLLEDAGGCRKFNMTWNGRRVRLRGIVRDIFGGKNSPSRMLIDDDGRMVAADCSTVHAAIEKLRLGSLVSITGVCVMETENWNRHSTLPRIMGMFVSVGSPNDVAIIATPPWWTITKLMAVIGVLALLLVAILIWNASLRILSERRGREMFRSQIARNRAEIRLDERTRLAAELHDHLAQSLTAISYQIASADRSRLVDANASARHISTAARMLGSCRTELRRCLWDLRSDTLDEPDVAHAVMKSVEPVVGKANAKVEFKAARAKISDSVLHAMLSIIRELAANAVNHGHANNIKIAGELTSGILTFSVSDDGCGFDVANAPGLDNGHFGLAGVRERIRRHGGDISINSAPGKGASIAITLKT